MIIRGKQKEAEKRKIFALRKIIVQGKTLKKNLTG
jgi:hypothetical protein